MTNQRVLAGGGRLTIQETGGRIRLYATRPQDSRGLYKVWIFGAGGRMLLGTMMPEGGSLQLSRTLSRTALQSAGCYPITGGEAVMAFAFQNQGQTAHLNPIPPGWEKAGDISGLFQDAILRQNIYSDDFIKKPDNSSFQLGILFDCKKEFPMIPLFCLCRSEKIGGEIYLVWKFDGSGRPIF